MIVKIADNITSPLGWDTASNYEAVLDNRSCLKLHEGKWGVPEPFMASLFEDGAISERFTSLGGDAAAYCRFEKLCILSVAEALKQVPHLDISSNRTAIVLSTTKGNVEALDRDFGGAGNEYLGYSAQKVADYFGISTTPVVVSNACISGLCAQIVAMRSLESGRYDTVIVMGADVQSRFIVTGFQSFKALSQEQCKPFDINRQGLNLGEAAATVIYHRVEDENKDCWQVVSGAIRNDANHISGPSRTGEGSYRAMRAVLEGFDLNEVGLVNVHGTSTPYNDEMEAIALGRIGLNNIYVNTLKGYYGHTMGAAGVLEAVLSMHALDHGIVLATRGYEQCGTSVPVNVSAQHRNTSAKSFVKLLSGFGGCNAAMLFKKGGDA